jgi:hypothetical protein
MLLWFVAAGGALAGVIALIILIGLRRRLDHLNQSYWELRYQCNQLRADLARLDPAAPKGASQEKDASQEQGGPQVSFVPLSTLKK